MTERRAGLTASQTAGPFFFGFVVNGHRADLAPAGIPGERIELVLSLLDADGTPVPDGLIEIWQANAGGRYRHPEDRRNIALDAGFEGFGRAATDRAGACRFATVRPGRVPWPEGGLQAAHINVSVFARGVLNRLATRLYFAADPALETDPVLRAVDPARRATLVAQSDGAPIWRLAIHLGGPRETVFFDI